MKPLKEVLQSAKAYIGEKPPRFAEEIVSFILSIPRDSLYLDSDQNVSMDEEETIRFYLDQCKRDKPLEYILKKVLFYGHEFQVDSRVLIPRPETEVWFDEAVQKIEKEGTEEKILWDLCTGSGCLGISAKLEFPSLNVVLSDLDETALQVAYCNLKNLNANAEIRRGDFLQPFEGERADFFFCNPPYVSEDEYPDLDTSVRDYEPKGALVAKENGTYFYRVLAENLSRFLNSGAWIFLEMGTGQGNIVQKLFEEQGLGTGEILKDWAGHDRAFFLKIS